ncbi:MAG: alpha/beta fold hydrolase [Gammaproteobacteria bacterium]
MAGAEQLRFVLVHGSMHDGSCWEQTIEVLTRQGHECWAPTLAGHGEQAGQSFTREDCVCSVVDYVEEHDIRDFILVGHSFAGIVLPDVTVKLVERIQRVVFQNAMIMNDGESLYDVIPPIHQQMFDTFIKKSGKKGIWMIPFEVFRDCFINTADRRTAEAVYAALRGVCVQAQLEPVPMQAFHKLDVPKSYINFTEDIALPHGEYGWYPRMAQRLGLCRVVQRPGDHEACYTCPEVLADALIEAGRP